MDKQTRTRLLRYGGVAAVLAVGGYRISQARSGDITAMAAASEIAAFVLVGLGLILAWTTWRDSESTDRIPLGVLLVAWVALGVAPLWWLGHPEPVLFEEPLELAKRDGVAAAAPADGTYWIEVRPPTDTQGVSEIDYLLRTKRGEDERVFTGAFEGGVDVHPITLNEGDRLDLFLEVSADGARVKLRRAPVAWSKVRLGLVVLFALSLLEELLARSRSKSLRGALSALVGATAVFVAILDPETMPSLKAVVGASFAAFAGGGLIGGLLGAFVGRLRGNS